MIDITELRTATLDPVVADELDRFEDGVRRYLAGELDDDEFRVFRLNQGIYGQRQGGTNQMVRVKIPYGKVEPDQLEMLAYVAETYSRGWGHLTTRQNVQFHFVELEQAHEVLRLGPASRNSDALGDLVAGQEIVVARRGLRRQRHHGHRLQRPMLAMPVADCGAQNR